MRVVVAAALAVLACAAPAGAVEVFAHRGGTMIDGVAAFPENTLPAFRHAARAGTALEFDVRITRDGVPLVIHDATFDRTTNCHGSVDAYDSKTVAPPLPRRLARRARRHRGADAAARCSPWRAATGCR